MKFIAMSLITALFLAAGCATNPNLPPTEQGAQNVRRMAAVAKLAAFDGTVLWLKEHPENRDAFVAAHGALAALTANPDGKLTAEDLLLALKGLPIKELQGPNGSLIVGNAVILFDAFFQQDVAIDTSRVAPVAAAIRDGLALGLGL